MGPAQEKQDDSQLDSVLTADSTHEFEIEDYFNPTWFNDEPFVQEMFRYGDIDIILCGLSWNTVQSGAGYTRIGHTLWAAGHFLADYLYHCPAVVKGKRILEIGCGLGLTGLVASKITDNPNNVILTDGDRNILDALQRNIELNFPDPCSAETAEFTVCQRPECAVLYWGESVEDFKVQHGQFDLILGADVLYTQKSLEPLISTMCALLKPDKASRILVAFQTQYGARYRNDLLQIASGHQLSFQRIEWTSSEVRLLKSLQDDDSSLELWEFTWKL